MGMMDVFVPSHVRHLVSALHVGLMMVVCGLRDGAADAPMLLEVELVQQFPMPNLKVGDDTRVLSNPPHTREDLYRLVDACCGLAGLTHGAHAVGMLTTVAVDCNAWMVDLHNAHGGYVTGDIGCPQVIAQGWAKDIRRIDAGCPMTVVSSVEVFDSRHERHLLGVVHNGALMEFCRLLDGGSEVVTLLDACVVTQYLVPVPTTGPDTTVLHHFPSWEHYVKLLDVCSSLGGMTHGALAVGVHTMVANDCNAKMDGLQKAHSGRHYVPGEAGNPPVVADTWRRSDRAAIKGAVCSCQLCPFGCCDVAPSDQWCHDNGSDGFLAACSSVVPSTQCRQNGLPFDEFALNGHGGLVTPFHDCGGGEAVAMVIEQIRLPTTRDQGLYTLLGSSVALMQCHVSVVGKVRLLTPLLFLSASRIRVALHPGPDGGGFKCVTAIPAGLCCLATFYRGVQWFVVAPFRRQYRVFNLLPIQYNNGLFEDGQKPVGGKLSLPAPMSLMHAVVAPFRRQSQVLYLLPIQYSNGLFEDGQKPVGGKLSLPASMSLMHAVVAPFRRQPRDLDRLPIPMAVSP